MLTSVDGQGRCCAVTSWILAALNAAVKDGADVALLPLRDGGQDQAGSPVFNRAAMRMARKGTLVVAPYRMLSLAPLDPEAQRTATADWGTAVPLPRLAVNEPLRERIASESAHLNYRVVGFWEGSAVRLREVDDRISAAETTEIYSTRSAGHRKSLVATSASMLVFWYLGELPRTVPSLPQASTLDPQAVVGCWAIVAIYFAVSFWASSRHDTERRRNEIRALRREFDRTMSDLTNELDEDLADVEIEYESYSATLGGGGHGLPARKIAKTREFLPSLFMRIPFPGTGIDGFVERLLPWLLFALAVAGATALLNGQIVSS